MSNALLADLEWRGLIAQSTDRKELESALSKPISVYLGVDPTAPSMHLGNLVVFLVLRRFQLAGHRPIALVGGATGLVGDPSGKNDERTLNEEEIVADWVHKIRKQVEKILDFKDKDASAKLVNNLDWTKPVSALGLLRDIGKHFSVNQMLAKDSVEGVRLTANALLQIAAQQQRENEARQAEIAEIRQRQEESDKRFEVLLSEVRYLIRQIKPGD